MEPTSDGHHNKDALSIADVLDLNCIYNVLQHLGAKELMAVAQHLWRDKAYVPQSVREMAVVDARTAYLLSRGDALRTHMTEEELCSFTWQFRFKHSAGPFWRLLVGEAPLKRWFHPPEVPGKSATMSGPKHDPLWAISPESGGEHYVWQFRYERDGIAGKYVQVNHYPSLKPSRSEDWGWHMENDWVEFTAACDAPGNPGKGNEPEHHPHAEHGHFVDAAIGAVNEALAAAVADLEAEEEELM